jgi:hypothetical protein
MDEIKLVLIEIETYLVYVSYFIAFAIGYHTGGQR